MFVIMKKIHIGAIIEEKVRESTMTITEFASRIHLERTSVYHIFKQESIDIERLKEISEVLGYDFINEIYRKQTIETVQPKKTVFIAVEIDADLLQQLNLPNDFIRLIKK